MNAKTILIPVVTLLVGIGLGFSLGQLIGELHDRQQVEAELQRLRGIIKEFWPIEPVILSLSGQVLEVRANSLLIETPLLHPLLEDLPTIREVVVADDTRLVKRVEKDPEVLAREMEEFMRLEEELRALIEAGIEPEEWPVFPEPFLEVEITLNEIEPGNRVSVEADKDIKWAERFTATRIIVGF